MNQQTTIFEDRAAKAVTTPSMPPQFVCDRCGFDKFVDVPIHGGTSTRRDCARCGLMACFPVWYGEENPINTRLAAAVEIASVAGQLRRQVLQFIAKRGAHGATDEELIAGLNMRESTARARRIELRDSGQVRDSKRRRRSTAGRECIVWISAGDSAQ